MSKSYREIYNEIQSSKIAPDFLDKTSIFVETRKDLIDFLDEFKIITLSSRCGQYKYNVNHFSDVPTESLPCPCSDPECFIIRIGCYEEPIPELNSKLNDLLGYLSNKKEKNA